jgi:hypothetical protein
MYKKIKDRKGITREAAVRAVFLCFFFRKEWLGYAGKNSFKQQGPGCLY